MIKIKHGYWLSPIARIVCFAVMASSIFSFTRHSTSLGGAIFFSILLVLAFIAISVRNYFELNVHDSTYHDYLNVLGFKIGEKVKFNSIEKLFINKVNLVSDNFKYTTAVVPASATETRESLYKCFIKFDNGEKVVLDFDKNKEKLINRLKDYNKTLKTIIYDTSSPDVVQVE